MAQTREAELAMSQDCTVDSSLGNTVRLISKKKKKILLIGLINNFSSTSGLLPPSLFKHLLNTFQIQEHHSQRFPPSWAPVLYSKVDEVMITPFSKGYKFRLYS